MYVDYCTCTTRAVLWQRLVTIFAFGQTGNLSYLHQTYTCMLGALDFKSLEIFGAQLVTARPCTTFYNSHQGNEHRDVTNIEVLLK